MNECCGEGGWGRAFPCELLVKEPGSGCVWPVLASFLCAIFSPRDRAVSVCVGVEEGCTHAPTPRGTPAAQP